MLRIIYNMDRPLSLTPRCHKRNYKRSSKKRGTRGELWSAQKTSLARLNVHLRCRQQKLAYTSYGWLSSGNGMCAQEVCFGVTTATATNPAHGNSVHEYVCPVKTLKFAKDDPRSILFFKYTYLSDQVLVRNNKEYAVAGRSRNAGGLQEIYMQTFGDFRRLKLPSLSLRNACTK